MIKYFDFEKDIEKIDNEISSIDQTDTSKKEVQKEAIAQ